MKLQSKYPALLLTMRWIYGSDWIILFLHNYTVPHKLNNQYTKNYFISFCQVCKVKPNSGDRWWSRVKMYETNDFKHFMILSNETPVLLDPTFYTRWAKCSSSLNCFCLSLASRTWLVLYGYYELLNQCALNVLFICAVYVNLL